MAKYPLPLKPGDNIRVVCPSSSLDSKSSERTKKSIEAFNDLGLEVSFGKNCFNQSASKQQRLDDLHQAFIDPDVKGVFTGTGGFSSNDLLADIDYKLIKKRPKVFCGYSDITVLLNAIYARTGLVTYHGPNFNGVGSKTGQKFTHAYLKKCLMSRSIFELEQSDQWFDKEHCDCHDSGEETKYENDGWWGINRSGIIEGRLIGGNISCTSLLTGTKFMPSLNKSVLLIEDDYEAQAHHFNALLNSILQQSGAGSIHGVIIGRFQKKTDITKEKLKEICQSKKQLDDVPIIANVDIGHTNPKTTLPIGGLVQMSALKDRLQIKVVEH
jgi:muramoyltetrapeptide carboxypeptidase